MEEMGEEGLERMKADLREDLREILESAEREINSVFSSNVIEEASFDDLLVLITLFGRHYMKAMESTGHLIRIKPSTPPIAKKTRRRK